jgi:hypothetical protein
MNIRQEDGEADKFLIAVTEPEFVRLFGSRTAVQRRARPPRYDGLRRSRPDAHPDRTARQQERRNLDVSESVTALASASGLLFGRCQHPAPGLGQHESGYECQKIST